MIRKIITIILVLLLIGVFVAMAFVGKEIAGDMDGLFDDKGSTTATGNKVTSDTPMFWFYDETEADWKGTYQLSAVPDRVHGYYTYKGVTYFAQKFSNDKNYATGTNPSNGNYIDGRVTEIYSNYDYSTATYGNYTYCLRATLDMVTQSEDMAFNVNGNEFIVPANESFLVIYAYMSNCTEPWKSSDDVRTYLEESYGLSFGYLDPVSPEGPFAECDET